MKLADRYEKGGLFQVRPLVAGPFDGLLDKQGGTVETGRVAVTDEDALAIEVVGCTMACGLELRLIAFQLSRFSLEATIQPSSFHWPVSDEADEVETVRRRYDITSYRTAGGVIF